MTIPKRQRGITLIEMLVALFIFSLISAATVGVLRLAMNGEESMRRTAATLNEIEMARAIIRADLMQVTNREVRDQTGFVRQPAVAGGDVHDRLREAGNGQLLLAIVVNGNTNFDYQHARSTLQYVEYLYLEGKIIRRSRDMLDATYTTPQKDRILLDNLEAADILFFDGQTWSDSFSSTLIRPLPPAITLDITHPIYGEIRQLFYGSVS